MTRSPRRRGGDEIHEERKHMYTTHTDALQELPEGQATGLYFDWEDVIYQTNDVDCHFTCNLTAVNNVSVH
ncbi:hypothetical protein LWC35_13610 [Pseudonocardia kujensis]|uniref:hypothetical protein n=1 Tax=Pseudonocardia kujensis TaxID=1128675 RepID=UPI001E314DFA|nr:hypothetical protein [Pseudonocardia kujensis]MCE0763939.1 hypothetical protein [Pseudonocardia kujensis]